MLSCSAPSSVDEGAAEARDTWVPPSEYAEGKLLSDLSPEIVTSLRAIHAHSQGQDRRFIRVGDSITKSRDFLVCLASTPLVGDLQPLEATRTFFDEAAWTRDSVASKVGWHTWEPYTGDPSPLATEIAAMTPAFAVVMLGTNDVYEGTEPTYEQHLTQLVGLLVAQGIIPVLSTIPPLRNASQDAVVPTMNQIVRKVAATAKIPLMDFHLALEPLPSHGIGADGIHPVAAPTGACDFSAQGLLAGYNQRNLLALRALDRLRLAILD
jgi:hypothetical protein